MPNSKKILLVEDIKVVSLKLNTILHKFGYDVLTANSGESAINQLSSNPQVNLILMDIDLGKGMSGVETATKILKKREIPIIFLTSYEDDEFIDQVRGVTRYGYLLKDSGDSVLKSTIEMALELFESRTALKKSERTLSNLMDSFPGIVYRYRNDTSKTLEFISRGCLDVCGTPSTDFMEKKTIHLRDLIFENEKDWVEKEINFSLNKKERFIVNYRIVSALKEVKWVEDQGIGVYSDSGELIAVEGFIEDITSRKSAEYALVESEERLKSIIEASNDGIWEWEIQTNKIYWSEKVYLMLGYSKKEFYSNYDSVLNLVHPEDRQKSKEDVRAYILSEEPFSVEIRFQKKDGNYGYFLCKGQVKKNSAGQTFGLIGSISDISERKIAEKKIKESLKFVNTIIELSPIGILTYNSKGECISVNPAACEIAGGSLDEFKKKSLWDLITVKDSKLSALIQEVINKNVSKQLELHGRSSFGKEFWIQAYLDSFLLNGENHILILMYNIFENKKSEEKIKKIEEQYKLIAENSSDVIWILNPVTKNFTYVSPSIYNLRGFTQEEILNNKAGVAMTPSSGKNVAYAIEDRLRKFQSGIDETYRDENQQYHKDGRILTVEVTTRYFRDKKNGGIFILGISRDVTQRKEAEKNLEKEKELLSVTLRSIRDAVITMNSIGNILMMNREAEILTEWSQEDSKSKFIDEVFRIHDKNSTEKFESILNIMIEKGGESDFTGNISLISKTGKEFIIAYSIAPICDSSSKTIGYVLVFRDISDKQKLIEYTQRADKLASLGVFAGGIAHDFNNLLAGIFGYLDLAREISPKGSKEKDYLEKAIKVFNRAKDLTHQLITFSKGGSPFKQTGQLGSLLKESVEFAMSGSNVTCFFEIAEDLQLTDFDENQIGQVIDNLVINSIQAMPNGGILTVSAKNLSVHAKDNSILEEGEYLWVSFRDTGVGIPQEILPKIFDPFYSTKPSGSGLGLPTVFSIIEKHGGKITVDSELNVGTTFHIYLPVVKGNVQTSKVIQQEKTHTGVGRVLVMDDEDFILEAHGQMLINMGYEVEYSKDGTEALEKIKKCTDNGNPFAFVIMDLTIPGGMGGKETIRELRNFDKNIIAFVSSGYSEDPIMANPREYGFNDKLPKPFKKIELEEKMLKYS